MPKAHIGTKEGKKLTYELNNLTRHGTVLGTTGSGKTVMCKVLIEEALQKGIPVIAVDPKGDIASLAVVNEEFDFRPFGSLNKKKAEKTASLYAQKVAEGSITKEGAQKLSGINTQVFTPKSTIGHPVSLIPDLRAPPKFKQKTAEDVTLIADFVEPVSESILHLAGIKGAQKEKVQSFISALLIHNWNAQKDLTLEDLIKQIIEPPITSMGSLPLEDVIKENDRRKVAALINLLLSSPSKRAWSQGDPLNVKNMFKKNSLTVFDLRYSGSVEEKQFVVEQLLQNIYRFLLEQGGTEKLKFILYFDELAGFLPPPPANPSCKKLLELLIRQARAFGLGIILATQNPGDIDYRVFGNIGTRFIGKLRTDNDIEKVATAMDLSPSVLKSDISGLNTGSFVFHNAVNNTMSLMQARWLHSYHGGPLQQKEIAWINDPSSVPEQQGTLEIKPLAPKKEKKVARSSAPSQDKEPRTSKRSLRVEKTDVVRTAGPTQKQKTHRDLQALVRDAKKYAKTADLKIAMASHDTFVPHVKIEVLPKPLKNLKFEKQGPYVADLVSTKAPLKKDLKYYSWKKPTSHGFEVISPRRSMRKVFETAVADAKKQLKETLYQSTLTREYARGKYDCELLNHKALRAKEKEEKKRVEERGKKLIAPIDKKISTNKKKMMQLRAKITATKAKRMVKSLLSKKKLATSTKPVEAAKRKIKSLTKENEKYRKAIDRIKKETKTKKARVEKNFDKRAKSAVRKVNYRPQNRDLEVKATILLVPKTR